MDRRVISKLYGLDPEFRAVYDQLYGVSKTGPDGADVHIDGAGRVTNPKRERHLAQTGLAATGVAGLGGVHAIMATTKNTKTDVKNVRRGEYQAGKVLRRLKLTPKKAIALGTAGWLGLHTTELVGDTLAARAQVRAIRASKKPDTPVAKAFTLKPLNAATLPPKQPSLRARARPGNTMIGKSVTMSAAISKIDTDQRLVFGWASVSELDGQPVLDLQGDVMPIDEVEKSAYQYVLHSRVGGDQHARVAKSDTAPKHTADLVESIVFTPDKIAAMGLPDSFRHAWWVGFHVNDEDTWQEIKSGKRTGFSVHGTGRREEVLV